MNSNNNGEKKETKQAIEKTEAKKTPKKQEYTCIQACNIFKLNGNIRNALKNIYLENKMTESEWKKMFTEKGFLQ